MSRCGESGLANWPCQPGNCPRCGHGAEEGAWACEDAGQCLADQLRTRLAEVESERDAAIAGSREIRGALLAAESRLAKVEAGLASEAEAHRHSAAGRAAAEARLAAVLALCDEDHGWDARHVHEIRAAARGEGDR